MSALPSRPYENKEYIDWITLTNNLTDTIDLTGGNRATLPTKMNIRDMAILIGGAPDDVVVKVQYSPDEMETKEIDLDMLTMEWFDRDDGTFQIPGTNPANVWENLDAAEGWFRIHISNIGASTDIFVFTRPRWETG